MVLVNRIAIFCDCTYQKCVIFVFAYAVFAEALL